MSNTENMPLTLIVKANEEAARSEREMAAQRVLDCFGLQLPNRRLLCFLDSQDWQAFKTEKGIANRGFYSRVKAAHPHWRIAPAYILESVFPNGVPAFDDLIYIHGGTCSNEVSLTMTLAHELQHFVQRTDQRRLWAANTLIPNEAVRNYIGAKIAERMTAADADDWECIQGLVTSTPYDLASETKLFFPRLKDHRPQLQVALRRFQSQDPDFAEIDLDALLSGTGG